jgi:hypothetical protein
MTGGGGGKGFLHTPRTRLVAGRGEPFFGRHGLRGIGARDPQRLDLTVGSGFEHFYRCQAGLAGTSATPPERSNFCAML